MKTSKNQIYNDLEEIRDWLEYKTKPGLKSISLMMDLIFTKGEREHVLEDLYQLRDDKMINDGLLDLGLSIFTSRYSPKIIRKDTGDVYYGR